jgi:hypothetical protein
MIDDPDNDKNNGSNPNAYQKYIIRIPKPFLNFMSNA